MKKTIPILLSAALLLSACGQAAGTAEEEEPAGPAPEAGRGGKLHCLKEGCGYEKE